MKIYISHSRHKFDYKKDLYQPIIDSDLFSQHQFILPHLNSEKPYLIREEITTLDAIIAEIIASIT